MIVLRCEKALSAVAYPTVGSCSLLAPETLYWGGYTSCLWGAEEVKHAYDLDFQDKYNL